jgi:DNA gyrase subunit A
MERPDLSNVPADVREYIEWLESRTQPDSGARERPAPALEPSEPETTMQVVVLSRSGLAKRTARHFYSRQRRGGMGVFDVELPDEDVPWLLTVADAGEHLLLLTDLGRAYRFPVSIIPETEVRARGTALLERLKLSNQERPVALLPADAGRQLALVSQRGWVRLVDRSHVGANLINGLRFHDSNQGGLLAAACWLEGDEELFVATASGQGIRFQSTQVPGRRGRLGARVDQGDAVVGVAAVDEDAGVFLLGEDGKGTIRLMSGFRLTKTPGSGTKAALKCDRLIHTQRVREEDDIFIISAQSKIIRFSAADIPPKEGLVQGVNCMALRNDAAVAATVAVL